MAVYRRKIWALAMKIEAIEGTDSVPALGTDAIRAANIVTASINDAQSGKRGDVQHAGLGQIARAVPVGRSVSFDVTVELFGKGTAYSALPASNADFQHDVLLRIAGHSRSYASGKVTYTTLDQGMETATAYLYASNGNLIKVVGCIAKPKMSLVAGQPGVMTYSVEGRLAADPVAATISGLVLPTVIPPVWADTSVAIGAWTTATAAPNALAPRKLDLDWQTASTWRNWAGAGGLMGVAITDRNIRASMDVEAVALTTFDPYTIARQDGTLGAGGIFTSLGGGAGNIIDLATGPWQTEQPADIDLGGIAGWTLQGDLVARGIAAGLGAGREIALSVS